MKIWSCIAFVLVCISALGAPPSEVVREPNIWLSFEPLMFPCLELGIVLALLSLVLSLASVRWSALACLAAVTSTMLGEIVAWNVDAEARLFGLLMPVGLLLLPAIGAATVISRDRREQRTNRAVSLEQRAG